MKQLVNKLKSNRILKSSAGLLVITLLVKVAGYVEKLVLANYFGTSYQVDVYLLVLGIVLSIFFLFREVVEPGFLNTFLEARNKGEEQIAWGLFNKGIHLIFFITLFIGIISYFFPNIISGVFAPGFKGEQLLLSNKMVKVIMPACIFLAISTLTSITLNGLKIFALPASGELAFKGAIIICMVVLYHSHGISAVAIGVVVGSVVRLGVHLTKLCRQINFKKVSISGSYKLQIWQLTWPLLIGVGFSQASGLIDNIFASYQQEGAIAALSYAKKIAELPVVVFPYVLSIVVFPYFSQLAIENREGKLKSLLADSLKWIVIAFVPIAMSIFVFAVPIVEIIFQRGAFDAESTMLTSRPLAVYSTGVVFFAIETILVVFYYGNADTKTPVFIGMACVVLNILLTWLFIRLIDFTGIALAFVVQKTVKNLTLLYLLKYKLTYNSKLVLTFLLKVLLASTVFLIVIIGYNVFLMKGYDGGTFGKIGTLALCLSAGGMIYLLALGRMGILKVSGDE